MSFAAYSVEAFAYECAPDPFIIQVAIIHDDDKDNDNDMMMISEDPFIIQVPIIIMIMTTMTRIDFS